MSVETLREAARLMRNRALAADAGTWKWAEQTHGEWYGIQSNHAALGTMFDPGNAFHVASWPPPVALAVADSLDVTAAEFEHGDHSEAWEPYEAALAVARTYLGEAS